MLDANPGLAPAGVRSLLQETALDRGSPGADYDYGAGRLDAYAAVRAAAAGSGEGPAVPAHALLSGGLENGRQNDHVVRVTDPAWPLAVTLLMPGWTGRQAPDFDLYVYAPDGTELGRSTGVGKQETVAVRISQTGDYRIRVLSYAGAGEYVADVSAGLGERGDAPPSVSFASPAEGATVSGVVPVRVQAADDVAVNRVDLAVDGGAWQPMSPSGAEWVLDWDTRTAGDGPHTLRARAVDSAGQEAAASRPVQVHNGSRQYERRMSGHVRPGQRDAWFEVDVGAAGFLDLELSWATNADLDFYVYDPQGRQAGLAYTLRRPEQLRVSTETWGTGRYRIRVNLYSGGASDFTLVARGLMRTTYTGTVTSTQRNTEHTHAVGQTGPARLVLAWSTSADLDFFLYDPQHRERGRAYTLRNPETLDVALDQVGDWKVRVNLYSGANTSYTMKFYAPAPILA